MDNPFDLINQRLCNIEKMLQELKCSAQTQPTRLSKEYWFDVKGLREYLPDKPARSTVYGWIHNALIPYHKTKDRKKLRFLKSEIDAWLKAGHQKTVLEIREEVDEILNR